MLTFLDEDTTLAQELALMATVAVPLFVGVSAEVTWRWLRAGYLAKERR